MITLNLENIKFSYQIGFNSYVKVLEGMSFNAHSGDIIGLIGKNGSGKTTLLNLLKGDISPIDGKLKFLFDLDSDSN